MLLSATKCGILYRVNCISLYVLDLNNHQLKLVG